MAGSCFYQLRQLGTVRRSTDAAKTLVHALISSRVDYCNSVLYRICEVHLRPLQSVLNAAAKLVTGERKFDHITDTIHARQATLASGATMPPVQTMYADHQVPSSQHGVIPNRQLHPSVNDDWSITSTVVFTP